MISSLVGFRYFMLKFSLKGSKAMPNSKNSLFGSVNYGIDGRDWEISTNPFLSGPLYYMYHHVDGGYSGGIACNKPALEVKIYIIKYGLG